MTRPPNLATTCIHVVAGILVFVISGYPLATLLYHGVSLGDGTGFRLLEAVFEGQSRLAIEHTLIVSTLAAALSTSVGVILALAVQRSDLPFRRAAGVAVLLPLLTPPFVQALAWLRAYARGGLTDHLAGHAAGWLSGGTGIIALLTVQTYPLVYLIVTAQIASLRSADLEEAARSAGARPWRTCIDVTLPLLAPAIGAGWLVAFVSAASDFGVPAILGIPGGYTVVTTLIYRELSFAAEPAALPRVVFLSTALALSALAALILAARLMRSASPSSTGVRRTSPGVLLPLGSWRWPLLGSLALLLGLSSVLPLAALLLQSVQPGFGLSLEPATWTLAHFATALDRGGFHAILISMFLAAASGAFIAVWGACLILPGGRTRIFGRLAQALAAMPFALPGTVVAVAAILAWQRWLYGTFLIILLAYVARFAIFGVRAAETAHGAIPVEMDQAGRSSGATPLRVALDIQRPLVQPALLAAFALVFLLAVHELTISSLLYSPATATVAVSVLNAQQAGDLNMTTALAVIVTALTLVVAIPLAFSGRLRRLIGAELRG